MKGIERLASVESTTPRMARALPEMPMDGTVLVRLIRISAFGMGNFFEPVFRELDLSEHSFHVLCLLVASENGTASPSELSEMVGTSRANMTHILEDLVEEGFVSRAIASRDARRHVIAITAAGRRKVRETVPQIVEPEMGQPGLADRPGPMLRNIDRLDYGPVCMGDNQVVIRQSNAEFEHVLRPLKAV